MRHHWWACAWLVVLGCGSGPSQDTATDPARQPTATADEAPADPPDPLVEELNLDFEQDKDGQPDKWYAGGDGYTAALDDANPHSGERSLRIASVEKKQFGVATSQFPVDRARGKRLELTGYLRTADVESGYAGLWMRVDGPNGAVLAFDNMQGRGVTGTTEWTRYQIVLSVPAEAVNISFGAILTGDGTMWVDTLRLKVLDSTDDSPVKLTGAVVDDKGNAVPDAFVALIAPFGNVPTATAISDATGNFEMTGPPGEYAITATAPGLRGAYVATRRYGHGTATDDLRVEMGGDAFTHTGTLVDEFGKPIADATVGLYRLSMDTGDIWYTRTGADGSFSFTVMPADQYVAILLGDKAFVDHVPVPGRSDQTVELVAVRVAPAPEEVVKWIGDKAIALTTVEAGNGFADMEKLRKLVGKARVVGLGEATHGTREFFQMKHRMLEFLVEKMGFTVFAIEANFPESVAINDYVLHGTGDAKQALAGIYFWTWNTEEVLELIEWMRTYNANPKHKRKLKFYGFDMQFGAVAAKQLLDYFKTVDPDYAKTVAERLGKMQSEEYLRDQASSLGEGIAAFGKRLDDNEKAYSNKTSRAAWQIARQNARVLAQQQKMHAAGSNVFEARDEAMAANIQWILDIEPKGTRVVAWAHNGHVTKTSLSGSKSMGVHLKNALGNEYVVFGFAFNRGGFQAMVQNEGLQAHEVGPAPEDTVGATFARAGCSVCILDLRSLRKGTVAAAWFGKPRRMRSIGAVFSSDAEMLSPHDLPGSYDALIFIDETTRARPVKNAE